jgi:hypothetical protein
MPATHTGNRRWGIRVVALSAGLTLAACGAAGLGGGANGTSRSATPSQSASPTPSPAPFGEVTRASLTKMAEQAAISAGDRGVRVADAVLTTRQAAVTLTSGSLINSNEAVYLVQLLGHFTLTGVSIPQKGTAPTGIALSFDVDVSDGNVVDTGLAHKAADLSSLGPVIVLTL